MMATHIQVVFYIMSKNTTLHIHKKQEKKQLFQLSSIGLGYDEFPLTKMILHYGFNSYILTCDVFYTTN